MREKVFNTIVAILMVIALVYLWYGTGLYNWASKAMLRQANCTRANGC